ncbi:hypothetical protein FRX31_033068 [Thalictrum thalictroides]|uniref:Uncharacterized protein n=1 Tax=Thalictrum thalictroides TaxID=46969 RepID=A0A7J6UY60_THATH|nr:hypothetical protein FRX31_033068 [Thalictrum thalictroides]
MLVIYALSFLSQPELEVAELILRQGRNVTLTSVEFRIKETNKLVYTTRLCARCEFVNSLNQGKLISQVIWSGL